jgi:outer membrane protein OmpA-like peptidoglycan-associated protein
MKQREAAKAKTEAKKAEEAAKAAAGAVPPTKTSASQYGVPIPLSAIPANLPAGSTVAPKGASESAYNFPGSFTPNNNAMRVSNRSHLNGIVTELNKHAGPIRIVGHTDSSGSANGNLRLGWLRAQSVKKLLVHLGIDAARIQVQSAGITQPTHSNDTADGREKNRRVVILSSKN